MRNVTFLSTFCVCLVLSACNTEQINDPLMLSDSEVSNNVRANPVNTPAARVVQESGLTPLSTVTTKQQQYQLSLTSPEQDFPLNEYFDLVVDVLNPVGQALPYPVELELDAGMRAHSHGMNTLPKIKALGGGRFLIEQMLFHMPGEWNLMFKVSRGVMGDSADIDVEVWP